MRNEWMQIATVCIWGLLAFSFSLSPAFISISFILLSIIGLLQFNFKSFTKFEAILSALFVLYFISSAVSFLYSQNHDEASRKLILKLPLLCFPLLFNALKKTDYKHFSSMVLIGLYAIYLPAVVSVYNYISNKTLFDQLILESKPLPIEFGYGIYHIQFSILLAISVVFGVYLLLHRKTWKLSSFNKTFIGIISILNFVFLHILSARTGLLALYFGLLMVLLPALLKMTLRNKIISVCAGFLLPIMILSASSSLRNRLSNTAADFEVAWSGKDANDYSFAMRVQAWKNAIQVIKKNPVIGVGIGDADKVLQENFANMNSSITPANRKNPHFQFLETAAQSGISSACLFLMILVFALFGNSNKNALLASVTLLLFLASCFESILERQASVVAFVAFIALALAFGSRDNKKELSFQL
jgi:O-antigen ligase